MTINRYNAWLRLKFSLVLLFTMAQSPSFGEIDHLQGEMVGEVTSQSAILQSRLTESTIPENKNLPGHAGIARFELADNRLFEDSTLTRWMQARPEDDFIVKIKVTGLAPSKRIYYRLLFGEDQESIRPGQTRSFKTLPDRNETSDVNFVVVTGMNYYFFHFGSYRSDNAYQGSDKHLGYPALESILKQKPDFFISTGDTVYFDHPGTRQFRSALAAGKNPLPGNHNGEQVETESGMRHKYHEQFVQQRFIDLFSVTPTYWQKDDHDYRANDSWPSMNFPISHELGLKNFREQLPVTDPDDPGAKTYRTHRVGMLLQLWFVEGRDYRSSNPAADGPEKTIWGKTQRDWLKQSLLESDATFKLLVSPTPMVGPDGGGKRDNHTNLKGFRHEGDSFFRWAKRERLDEKGFYIVCGDRHWQYQSIHPSGFEEFSCGGLVDANSRLGVNPGKRNSSDPDSKVSQPFTSRVPSGGYLQVLVSGKQNEAKLRRVFRDENGEILHEVEKTRSTE